MSNESFIAQSNAVWEKLAEWWDEDIADGDPFHRALVFPSVLALLGNLNVSRVLDIGCGNGALSRQIAHCGAKVLGVDVSATFVERAKQRSPDNIHFQVLDATSKSELLSLADKPCFDHVVCSMTLHDLPTINPLFEALPYLLKPTGSFIFTVPHPCFNSGEVKLNFLNQDATIERSRYIRVEHFTMKSKRDQPLDQHVVHRPLSVIFQALFRAGMVLDGMEEPALCNVQEETELDWAMLPEIPPALICRWIFQK